MRSLAAHLRFWLPAIGFLALDLGSKHWAFHSLPAHTSKVIIPHVVDFHRSLNDGAVFGSFTGQVRLFMIASLVAVAFVVFMFSKTPPNHAVTHVALGLILAGALGNFYDRMMVRADIVHYTAPSGEIVTRIGKVVERTEDVIRIGDWPDGSHVQVLDADKVQVRSQGVVRDFIKFTPHFPQWVPRLGGKDVWPWVFNVADAALVCGVIVLLLTSWGESRREEQA